MFWITKNPNGAFAACDVHGQTIYIDSNSRNGHRSFCITPDGSKLNHDATSLPAYQAVADYLTEKDS